MTREEEIDAMARRYADNILEITEFCKEDMYSAYVVGAMWADENPNKKLVYTKKELLNMGFGFDLNGNIVTLQEIEEMTKNISTTKRTNGLKTLANGLKTINTYMKYCHLEV